MSLNKIDKFAVIRKRIDQLVKEQHEADKRCWNLELDTQIGDTISRLFSDALKEASEYYGQKNIYISVMGNRVKKDILGSGGGWHQDTRIKPQKKWFVYLNDVDNMQRGPTQFLNVYQTIFIKVLELFCFNFGNRVNLNLSNWFCNMWGKYAVHKKGIMFSADTRLIHRGTPIEEDGFERYALTLYAYGKHTPANMTLTKIEL